MTLKPDLIKIEGFSLLKEEQKSLFINTWYNIAEKCMFNCDSLKFPTKIFEAVDIEYILKDQDDIEREIVYHTLNLSDMNEYIKQIENIEAKKKMYENINYTYTANRINDRKYLHITALYNNRERIFKVYSEEDYI